jgi:hypothetical protein
VKRNPGVRTHAVPDFAALYPGYNANHILQERFSRVSVITFVEQAF